MIAIQKKQYALKFGNVSGIKLISCNMHSNKNVIGRISGISLMYLFLVTGNRLSLSKSVKISFHVQFAMVFSENEMLY